MVHLPFFSTLSFRSTLSYDRSMRDKLLAFFHSLNRSDFIDTKYKGYADLNRPLPIGYGQTISQPSLVFYMTEHLELEKHHKVLEIGTGSGYQSAFLSAFGGELYTIEYIEELATKAKDRLTRLGYSNIHYKIGDGSEGWAEHAPYDRIMVTAAPKKMPTTLIEQLAPEGIMVLPVGGSGIQDLVKITKDADGTVTETKLLDVVFVEMVGRFSP